jgi:3-hydroxybutyryl-CoA dehydrogenase
MTPQPTADAVRSVLVVGSGAMGTQIGAVFALAGYDVTTSDLAPDALARSRDEVRRRLGRLAEKGARTREEVDAALGRMAYTTDSLQAARSTDFVVEAAVERLDIKRQLFADLDEVAPEHTVLATNSSTIPSSLLMDATGRPDRVCNMHFFNPALVMACVEVVRNPQTSDATVETTVELARRLGKQPVRLNQEVPGFVANRLLGALRDEALRLEAAGVASFEDIDTAARTALGHPMGPFELMDLVGIDVSYLIRLAEHEQSGDPADLPHPSVQKLYEQGHYGRKSGRGWYEYAG